MNKTQQTLTNQLKWGLHQPKYSMSKSTLVTRNGSNTRDFNQDMLKIVIVSQGYKNNESLKNAHLQNLSQLKQKGNENNEIIPVMQKENMSDKENKMLNSQKTQQKIQSQNRINIKSQVLQTLKQTSSSTNDHSKNTQSISQHISNKENCELIDDRTNSRSKIETNGSNYETNDCQNTLDVENESQIKNRLIKSCSQPMNLKINDTLYEKEKQQLTVCDSDLHQQENIDNKKQEFQVKRMSIKQKNSMQQPQQIHNKHKHSFTSRVNLIANKVQAIKDMRNEKQMEKLISQTPITKQQNKRLSFYNSNQKSINSQRTLICIDQENYELKKAERSISQRLYNETEFQQINTQQAANQYHHTYYDKKGFSSLMSEQMSSMQELSPKYNTMIQPRDRFLIQNAQLIKKAQVMSSINKNGHDKLIAQQSQLNFPTGPFYSTQSIHSLKPQKNYTGTLFIQALIPSQQQQILSPKQSNQIQNIEEFQSTRRKSNLFIKRNTNNVTGSLNNKIEDENNQNDSSFYREMRIPGLNLENLSNYQQENLIKKYINSLQKNFQGQDLLQDSIAFKEDLFTLAKDKLAQQLNQLKYQQKNIYSSLHQTYQNNISNLITSRQSHIANSYMQKKKIPTFQSQRDLSANEQSENNIDLAPFTLQNKETAYLQNLIQKIDDQEVLCTQNSQPKYRYLKSNVSLNQSVDNEDEDLYNYTQSVKVQNLNNPGDLEMNVEVL